MASKKQLGVCTGFCILGLIAAIVAGILPCWVISLVPRNNLLAIYLYEGLWMKCVFVGSNYQCKTYTDLAAHGPEIQTARAMSVLSCVMSAVSVLVLFKSYRKHEEAKPKKLLAVSLAMIISGVMLLISISWIAGNIEMGYYRGVDILTFVSPGLCIYMGGVGGVLLVLGGGLLSCFRNTGSGGTTMISSNKTSATAV